MRKTNDTSDLKVIAIAGTYVVTLGFNLPEDQCEGLLGFSIHRTDHTENEAYYLEGMKCFTETDPGFPSGSLYSTKNQPIQGFQWADYSAKPKHSYTYTITALKGTPDNLTPFLTTEVKITTEDTDANKHDIYFNRGTAGSQEYVRRFGNKAPDKVSNPKAAYDWLSRGLYEAMIKFVNDCIAQNHSLRIAAYEFHHEPFLQVLKKAIDSGVDIQIVYDARKNNPKTKNEAAIRNVGLENFCTPRTEGKSYISHNKFMVKLDENGNPFSVWTGGTNFSDGGIYGHSNVAHVAEDTELANLYYSYWNALKDDLTVAKIKKETENISTIPDNPPPIGTSALFSPRENLDALNYYADLAMSSTAGLFMTFAFGINKVFKDVYRNTNAPFRLALLEKATRPYKKTEVDARLADEQEIQELRNLPENTFAIGEFIRTNEFDGWVKERLTGLNKNVNYVHNKFMLVDPLSDNPIVIAGSANFSDASTIQNDENMLIIRKNKRVADIYFGEFIRLFSHFSFRESLKWRTPNDPPKPLRTDDWWKEYFRNNPRSTKRKYFAQVDK
jgi:phosphatidylserine/phosphatidylglycerophosphate/cardiolipin synthase-like enzyme